jgi:hypothetical protein
MSSAPNSPDLRCDDRQSRRRRLGTLIGAAGLLISAVPSLYILYGVAGMWWTLATMANPPQGIRPMGFAMAVFAAMAAGLVVCAPLCLLCSWAARRLGSEDGFQLAKAGAGLWALPWVIGLVGVWLMCYFTGVQLGS